MYVVTATFQAKLFHYFYFEAPFVTGAKQQHWNPVDKSLTNSQWGTPSHKMTREMASTGHTLKFLPI
jgi:hypothetical protein